MGHKLTQFQTEKTFSHGYMFLLSKSFFLFLTFSKISIKAVYASKQRVTDYSFIKPDM